jgi:hypothetical protein
MSTHAASGPAISARNLTRRFGKLVSQSALDQQRAKRDGAAGTEKQATARLHLLLEGTRSEEVQQGDATLKQAEAALAEL